MILLDTHAWVWWVAEPRRLSPKARMNIESADHLGVCVVSCWEVAMLVSKGRLELDRDVLEWIEQALALPRVTLYPLSPRIAVTATQLPEPFHADPADRMIAATARSLGAILITKDMLLRRWGHMSTLW